jgi:hypothetical protein
LSIKALEGFYRQLAISGAPFSGCWKAWLIIVMGENEVGKEKERER